MKNGQPLLSEEVSSRIVDVQDIVNSVVALNDAMQMAASGLGQRHQANALLLVSTCISERLDRIDELLDALLSGGQMNMAEEA